MSSQGRVPAGVPSGGQFAASAHAEATGVVLAGPGSSREASAPDAETERVRAAFGNVDRMIARATADGAMTEVERQDDVEFDLRQDFPHLDQPEFDERMSGIGQIAEQIAVVEAAEDTDTEAYADAAWGVNLDLADFPATDREPGDAYSDCAAFKSGVIEALDGKMFDQVRALVRADAQAGRDAASADVVPRSA